MSGFVYIWFDKKRKRFYIGSHWGSENDGYICSSKWMRDAYRRRPSDFRRRILSRVETNRADVILKEYEWLSLISEQELGSRYYNLTKHRNGHWTTEESRREEISRKIREAPLRRQRISESNKGKKLSEATKEKIRIARSKQVVSEETKEKIRQANLKREYGDKFKATMREVALKRPKQNLFGGHPGKNGMLGKSHSAETKRNMSAAAKYKVSCPHCGEVGSANPMRRWHFNNCKHLTGVS